MTSSTVDERVIPRRRALLLYLASTAASAAAGIGVIPVLVHSFGSAQWGGLVTGQAIGAIAATVVLFGWGVGGPAEVARRGTTDRVQYYVDSLVARVVLFVPVAVASCVISMFVGGQRAGLVALAAVATAATSLGAAWFFVGVSRPDRLLWFDTAPRVVGTALGLLLAVVARQVEILPFVQLIAALSGAVLSAAVVSRRRSRAPLERQDRSRVHRALAGQVDGVITALTASSYTSLPVVVVAAMTPASLPVFALADRLTRYASTALTPAAQVLQGWVPSGAVEALHSRVRRGAIVSILLGLVAGAVLAAAAGPLGALLSGGRIGISLWYALWSGVVLGCLISTRGLGLACLTALGRTRSVAFSTVCGAVVGVIALIVLTPLAGGAGAVLAVGLSELVVLFFQLVALRRAMRPGSSPTRGGRGEAGIRLAARMQRRAVAHPLGETRGS